MREMSNMSEKSSRQYLAFVIPSVLAFALSGVYTIVDGFFIGHSMGDAGIAAVTIGYPVCVLIQAFGTGIGLSGAIRYTILGAQNEKKKMEECFTSTTILMLIFSVVLTGLLYAAAGLMMSMLGATGEILAMATEYVEVVAAGAACQLLATGFVPFIRNMGGAKFAMVAMILGFVTNIVLDYVLVWVMGTGMFGAALATVIGQALTMAAALLFFILKRCPLPLSKPSEMVHLWGRLLKVAVSPFGLTFSSTLTLLFMNRFLLLYGTDLDLAIFGCIDYVFCIIYLLLQGVGDGSQPLISDSYGAGKPKSVRDLRMMAYKFASYLSIIFIIGVFLIRDLMGPLFGASEEATAGVVHYLPWFLATLLFLSFSRITTTYFYATEQTGYSYILVYGEPLLTLLLLVVLPFMMPQSMKLTGVWLAMPMAQLLNCMIAIVLKQIVDKKMLKEEQRRRY